MAISPQAARRRYSQSRVSQAVEEEEQEAEEERAAQQHSPKRDRWTTRRRGHLPERFEKHI